MTTQPPECTGPAGRRLWDSVIADFELEEHELALLTEAVRTVDLLNVLAEHLCHDGVLLGAEHLRVHPAAVEARQQRIALARLLAALRLPAGEVEDRPQRRVGVRRPYRLTS